MGSEPADRDGGGVRLTSPRQVRVAICRIQRSRAFAERRAIDFAEIKTALCGIIEDGLEAEGWSHVAAEGVTGVAAQDFSRIRNRRVEFFKVERLLYILHRMGRDIELKVDVS